VIDESFEWVLEELRVFFFSDDEVMENFIRALIELITNFTVSSSV